MAESQLTSSKTRGSLLQIEGVPVFLYHQLTARTEDNGSQYQVSVSQFAGQLTRIREFGRQTVGLKDLWNFAAADNVGLGRLAVITFDDGLRSDYDFALPTLLSSGSRADFFINTANVGLPGYLGWEQILEMRAAGMGIYSHAHNHVVLSRLSMTALMDQLQRSKSMLEDHLSCEVNILAVPYGFLNSIVLDIAFQVGYKAVCDSFNWFARPGAKRIHRVAIYPNMAANEFDQLLDGSLYRYAARASRTILAYLPKQVLLTLRPASLGVAVLGNRS